MTLQTNKKKESQMDNPVVPAHEGPAPEEERRSRGVRIAGIGFILVFITVIGDSLVFNMLWTFLAVIGFAFVFSGLWMAKKN
jgi:hypothetical protein